MISEKLLHQFREAVIAGQTDQVRRLLQSHPILRRSVNAPIFDFDSTAIMRAKKNLAMVDLLLSHGANINLKSQWKLGGWGILDDADKKTAEALIGRGAIIGVFAAVHLNKLDRLRELLDADPKLVHAKGGDGCLPLHFAKSAKAIDMLLSRGAEIDARDDDHAGTAAQWAIPNMKVVRLLIDRGAAVDVFMAAALGDAKILRNVLDENPHAIDAYVGSENYPPCPKAPGQHIYAYKFTQGKAAFQIASDFGNKECMKLLLRRSSLKQQMLSACSIADEFAAKKILRKNPNLISQLARDEQSIIAAAAWAGNFAAVKLMLDLGFNPVARRKDGATALHNAAWFGRGKIIKLILSHKASKSRLKEIVNVIEPRYKSDPLGWCCHGSENCRNPKGDYGAVATMLLQAGANKAEAHLNDGSDAVKSAIRDLVHSRAPSPARSG